ncbi:MAG: cobalamin biosynthesis protein CbiX [Verrucomicrobiales bacterium]|nr:cobalamin biosynthesis protein CbiX [Verrucomicrobiales bacterium]
MNDDFSKDTLVLVGHGSALNGEFSMPTNRQAAELRSRKVFGQVLEAFWQTEPDLSGVLRGAAGRRVFIVPMFLSEGYFTEEVIPREMGFECLGEKQYSRSQTIGEQDVYCCGPVGTHETMTEVLLASAQGVIEQHPFPRAPKPADCSLFVAGRGTSNNENSRKVIESHVELIGERGIYRDVHASFMEEDPKIEACWTKAETKNLVMVPFFISAGPHSYEHIPKMLGEPERMVRKRLDADQPTWRNPTERNGKRLWYSRCIGDEPTLADVILQRAREVQ